MKARGNRCIIGEVKRIVLTAGMLVLAACARKNIENKDAIRQAVVEYLSLRQSQTGLDVSAMDVNVTAMAFERDTARATVDFRVKNGEGGMQFNYTLDRKGDKWVVQARQDSGQAHGIVTPADKGDLPAGHPANPEKAPASPKQ